MIDNYRDHAANERTMLAWVRTALAIVAFGFVVEKLNLFIKLSGTLTDGDLTSAEYAEWIGGLLIASGVVVLVLSLVRYFRTSREIESPRRFRETARASDAVLFVMLAILVAPVALFLGHTLHLTP